METDEVIKPDTLVKIRRINVRSVDFDGCVFNSAFQFLDPNIPFDPNEPENNLNLSENRLIEANEDFLTTISQEIQHANYDEVQFMVGSNRQSYRDDTANSHRIINSASCFPALIALTEEVTKRTGKNIICNRYLLSDGQKYEAGYSFNNAIKSKENQCPDHPKHTPDELKITLLYVQMHRMSVENPGDEIVFDFYDDRDDILKELLNFYTQSPNLVPYNVTLRLHQYAGKAITPIGRVDGRGISDADYSNSLEIMEKYIDRGTLIKQGTHRINLPVDAFLRARQAAHQLPHKIRKIPAIQAAQNNYVKNVLIRLKNRYPSSQLSAFFSALHTLHDDLSEHIVAQQDQVSLEKIIESAAYRICLATIKMLDALNELGPQGTREQKLAIIQAYENECRQTDGWTTFGYVIAMLIIALVGLAVGAGIGYGIGIGIGAEWTNPIDAIMSIVDMFNGTVADAAIVFFTATLVTGVAAGVIAGITFFKPDKISQDISAVAAAAREDVTEMKSSGPVSILAGGSSL